MKRIIPLLLCAVLLLCSCRRGPEPSDTVITAPVTDVSTGISIDTDLLFTAAGFRRVHDDSLDADWIIPEGASGLYARILVYGDAISLRCVLEGGGALSVDGKTYEITNGDVLADGDLLSALRSVAAGGAATAASRPVTDGEAELLKTTLRLYDAALGANYIIDTEQRSGLETSCYGDGEAIYDGGKYTVRFPASFEIKSDGGAVTLLSGLSKQRTVRISVSDSPFNENINDGDAVKAAVDSLGGTLVSSVVATRVGGRDAYAYSYMKDGVYVIQYFVDGGDVTYILTGASYDEYDAIPKNIISTFKVK